jgi:hypothetical protein
MRARKEPLRVRGTYVGSYDAMSCMICRFYYFTDSEYDLALRDARSLGLVGPPLPMISFKIVSEELHYSVLRMSGSSPVVFPQEKKPGIPWSNLIEPPILHSPREVLAPVAIGVGE